MNRLFDAGYLITEIKLWLLISMKTCNTCLTLKSFDDFCNDKSKSDGKSTQCKSCKKSYRSANSLKLSLDRRSYYQKNIDKEKLYRKLYAEQNPEKTKSATSAWREANANKVKSYRIKNAHKYNFVMAKYRSKKSLAMPAWFDSERHLVERVYLEAKKRGLQVDHIVPLQSDLVCGLHTWANLQILDKKLNVSKGNRYWPDHPKD